MSRKIVAGVLLFCWLLSSVAFARAAGPELTALDKLTSMEQLYYGSEQTGSLVDRTSRLEKEIYGSLTQDALMVKVDRLYNYTEVTLPDSPSFIVRLNAVEWNLMHSVSNLPGKARLESLEKALTGSPIQGGMEYRLDRLLKLAYSSGQVAVGEATVRQDSLI